MDLLLIFAIVYFLQNAAVDFKYAAQGKTSPRWEAKLQRLRQAGKPAVKPRYGSREWLADLWSDGLEAHTARRRTRTAGRKAEMKAADLDAATEQALAVVASTPATPVKQAVEPKPVVEESVPAPEAAAPAPVPAVDSRPDAQVIPMFPTLKEVSDMSAAEVTGLQSAIAYTQATASAHDVHSTAGGEGFIGSLQQAGVTGETIQLVADAQAASAMAGRAWAAAGEALGKQNTVKEAYDAVPDAGTQQFVQAE